MDRALAGSGVLVVAIDMTLAPESPYPACVQDANYGVRWLKSNAARWNGSSSKIGVYGSSSGGHVAELLACVRAMCGITPSLFRGGPVERRGLLAMRSPISDPYARFQNAERLKRDPMMKNTTSSSTPGEDRRKQSAGDSRAPRAGEARAAAHHARRARRQHAAGGSGEIRRHLQGGRWRSASSSCSRAANTNGSPGRDRRQPRPRRWSKRSSRAR